MHEMGITQEVLASVTRAAEDAGAVRITSVTLTVGELTEVVPDALHFAWEALTPGTLAEGADLEIMHVDARSRCSDCGHEFTHDRWDRSCPACKGYLTYILSGRQLTVDAVEVDLPDDDGAPREAPPARAGA